jgi:hypothetical protein
MATTILDLKEWLARGKRKGASHMIIVCDTFNWEDFPVYVMPEQDARKEFNTENKKPMQKVMEIYNLNKDLEPQINQHRAMEF